MLNNKIMKYFGLGILGTIAIMLWTLPLLVPVLDMIWIFINLSAFIGFVTWAIKEDY